MIKTNRLQTAAGTHEVKVEDIANLVNNTTSMPSTPKKGDTYFNETLGRPVWFDGTKWVDATGGTV